MPAWFRTRMVGSRKVFVELLEDGRLLLEPEKDKLTADEVLRHERAKYENAVRRHLHEVRRDRPPTV